MNIMREDIRFSKQSATLTHDSARGKVKRNATNFTRGSQLFHHEVLMTWAGIACPSIRGSERLSYCSSCSGFSPSKITKFISFFNAALAVVWDWMSLDPMKAVNLTLPSGQIVQGTMGMVPYHPAVEAAWSRAIQVTVSSMLGAAFICVPLSVWFIDFSRRRGADILTERHERGSVLIGFQKLADAIARHNWKEHVRECLSRDPAEDPEDVLKEDLKSRIRSRFTPSVQDGWPTHAVAPRAKPRHVRRVRPALVKQPS